MEAGKRSKHLFLGQWFAMAAMCVMADASMAQVQAAGAPAAGKQLAVGLHYVVPPFIGGAKVRTPETPDSAMAEELATRLGRELDAVRLDEAKSGGGHAALSLATMARGQPVPPSTVALPVGYVARPMAIMRTDTDIKTWEQLKGRRVCLSEGGRYVGVMAARYGAVEYVHKAPADSLLALRTDGCDAAVHDDIMLKELVKLPEWKKFSASLPPGDRSDLVFLAPAADERMLGVLKDLIREWESSKYQAAMTRQRVRDIAFEVYLDQVVADCH